jgi:predicted nucleotidyltransferase
LTDTLVSRDVRSALVDKLAAYHSVEIRQVLDTIAYLRSDGDSVIAGGSLAMGLGNHLSDLDIVIVGERTVASSRVPLEHFLDSLRVDVWVMSQMLIDEVFRRADRSLRTNGRVDDLFGDVDNEVNLKLVHRIAFGVHLDGPALCRAALAARSHAEIARELVVREYLERMREHVLLAQLAMTFDRRVMAVVNAREAVEEALHATITAGGAPFTGHKWLAERLIKEHPTLARRHRRFATLPGAGEKWRVFVNEAIDECETLSKFELALADLVPRCCWVNSDLRSTRIGLNRVMLVSCKVGGIWQLDPQEIHTWRSLVGSDEDPSGASWRCSELAPEQTALCVELYEEGLLSLCWLSGLDHRVCLPGRGSAG